MLAGLFPSPLVAAQYWRAWLGVHEPSVHRPGRGAAAARGAKLTLSHAGFMLAGALLLATGVGVPPALCAGPRALRPRPLQPYPL